MGGDTVSSTRLATSGIAGAIGVVADGTPLEVPFSEELLAELHHVIARHGVVVFRGLDIDEAGHLELSRQLGEIRVPPEYFPTLAERGYPEIGTLVSPGMGSYTDTWHSDVTWLPNPPRYSILHMRTCPDIGGDTMWASLTDAYDRLSPTMKRICESLTAEHAVGENRAVQPIVHVHPVTGRRALGVNPLWTKVICDMEESESEALLKLLYDVMLRPESTCRWNWQEGDLAIWDNHFVLHYVVQDYGDKVRVINRIEIEGEPFVPVYRSSPLG